MSQGHIVIIDDDPMIRFLVEEYLKASGFTVEAYDNGLSALAALSGCSPSLIVLDMQMPHMNGLEVLERLRSDPATAALPVLLLSANASEARELATVQPNGYLEKPFQMHELLAAVDAFKLGSSIK